jgi:hypothetical protein
MQLGVMHRSEVLFLDFVQQRVTVMHASNTQAIININLGGKARIENQLTSQRKFGLNQTYFKFDLMSKGRR